jgi:hypothetical protein
MSGFDVMGGAEVFAMPFRAGLDVVAISRRLGHSLPVVTLRISAHLFKRDDSGAVAAIEAVMRTQGQQAKR